MPSVILQHVETLSNAHIVATADPGVSIAYTLDARSQVAHEPGLQRHVQVRPHCAMYCVTIKARAVTAAATPIITITSAIILIISPPDARHVGLLQHVRALRGKRPHGVVCIR